MHKDVFQEKTKILAKQNLAEDFFLLKLSSVRIAANARPGQFVEVRISDALAPFLRRPLGVHRVGRGGFELLFQVVGSGTEILSKKLPGEYLDIIGPLGRGFKIAGAGECSILVAGGMGVAPLVFLAEKLAELKTKSAKRKTIILIGAKTKSQILCEKGFKAFGCAVKIATDDGSSGFKGYVSELLKKVLRENEKTRKRENEIYACGPKPMLREVSKLAAEYDLPAQISMEEHMACGIGACLGCVVNTRDGFKRVCKDGPVFESKEIIW